MIKKETFKEIGLVSNYLQPLTPDVNYNNPAREIEVVIACLTEGNAGNQRPQNFRLESETPKRSFGGCSAKIWAYKSEYSRTVNEANIFANQGPKCEDGRGAEYRHGLHAVTRIETVMQAYQSSRGNCIDAADSLGRWLEACNIGQVYCRPKLHSGGWLNEGEWEIYTVGHFVDLVRANLYNPAKEAAAELAA